MSIQKISLKLPPDLKGRLDQSVFLAAETQAPKATLSKSFIRKLIVAGGVYLNGKRCRVASRAVRGGERVDLYINSELASSSVARPPEKTLPALRVLYEDEAVICFDKPAGLPTQPTVDDARANLFEMAKKLVQKKDGPGAYLGLHHRLDRDTSGVMLLTRDSKFNTFIADQFKEHLCTKIYVAVLEGSLSKQSDRIETFMAEVGRVGKIAKFGNVKSGGKKAITEYTVLQRNSRFSLVELKILTGRTHQIRVHMSSLGHPVVGDFLYGSKPEYCKKAGRHFLHAHSLEFTHPVTKNQILVESPVPPIFREWVD
ncbi:MAG TPA: RluA family pseudouridine synthase [Oligoflexia bacterium]|nr:RluA family pseudouridine synthase [Oligoflexia bacterium]